MRNSFQFRIILAVVAMTLLLVFIGILGYMTTRDLQKVARTILKENVTSLKAAEELELAMVNQKGYVASYFLDGDKKWLTTLEEKKKEFKVWYKNAQEVALTREEKDILQDILALYQTYDAQRNRAIKLFQAGQIQVASRILLEDMKDSLNALYQRCEDLILANEALIAQSEMNSQRNAARMTLLTWTMILMTLSLGSLFGFSLARKFNEQLIRSAQMSSLGQIAANIAHEIRNPITSIKMRLYTLRSELRQNSGAAEDLGVIQEDIDNMERTVKNFLDFARLPEPKFEAEELKTVLDSIVLLLLPNARALNINIVKVYADAPRTLIRIDKEQVRRAFLNIVLNAMEAMPQGGNLEISLVVRDGREAEVRFKDNGKGMDAAIRGKMFEPFFTTKKDGTGLGLFITAKIVSAHEGRLRVDSRPGEGTTVTVVLPVAGEKTARS